MSEPGRLRTEPSVSASPPAVGRERTRRRGMTCLMVAVATVVTSLGPTPGALAVNAEHGTVVSADPENVTPHVENGSVQSITQVGDTIFAAGTFTTVRDQGSTATLARRSIFAFDARTGAIVPGFAPTFDGEINSLATDGTYVYAGGGFSVVNGQTRRKVVKLTTSGQLAPGQPPGADNYVADVVVHGDRLYVGGLFTRVGGQPRLGLAAVNKDTGVLAPDVDVPFTGTYNGGVTGIKRMDVSADGRALVAVGNFATVGGLPREQVVKIDLPTSGAATVSGWATDRYSQALNNCSNSFDTVMRDVDLSPAGNYFVVTTTGAFGGGAAAGALCDTNARWETSPATSGQQPTWVNYTGGDTSYGVAVTGAAVYVGGHMRWANNPFRADRPGPGAVPREGIVALDPANGLPLSWNPGRTRGVGAQALFATPQGLWVGSDTNRFAGELRSRIAFLPLTGGTEVPSVAAATLPGHLYAVPQVTTGDGRLTRRPTLASGQPTGAVGTVDTSTSWAAARGTFLVGSTLYYGTSAGLSARSFHEGALGEARQVNLYDAPDTGARIPFPTDRLSGAFYDTALHRLYYTVAGDSRLYYRYFTPESEVVGAQTFVANAGGVSFSTTAGMTLADGRIFFGSTADGVLRSVAFTQGTVSGPVAVVDSDGTWRAHGMFVAGPVPNQAPTAAFTSSCVDLRCSFDATASVDSDGEIVSHTWQFADGATATGRAVTHAFASPGNPVVTLTVTDDDGATSTTQQSVTVTEPPPAAGTVTFAGATWASGNTTSARVTLPADAQAGDQLLLFLTANRATTSTGPGAAGSWTLLESRTGSGGDLQTWVWARTAVTGDAGSTITVPLRDAAKYVVSVSAYRGAAVDSSASVAETQARADHSTPAVTVDDTGSWLVSYWSDKSSATTDWTSPLGVTDRTEALTTGTGRVTSLLADSGPVPNGPAAPLTATAVGATTSTGPAGSASAKAVTVSVVLRPA